MKKEGFATKWGFILAAAGSAIGLGNIWRFPYLVGEYGGFGFLLMYLLIILIICNPLMVSEISLGRTAKSNFVDSYKVIGEKIGLKRTWIWQFFGGWIGFVGVIMIISFYFLVAGWVLYYLFEALNGEILLTQPEKLPQSFQMLTSNFALQYACGLVFLLMTAMVVIAGVKNGIEKTGLILMPILFIIFIVLTIQSLFLDGAVDGIKFMFVPDWASLGFEESGFNWHRFSSLFMAALGQAFISLSLGYGILMVYGSYLSNKENLFSTVKYIETFDTLAAFLSALIIIPAIFSAGIPSSSGPGLTFISLPLVFQKMNFGQVWAVMFYMLLTLATLTSTISIYEALTNLFINKFNFKRANAVFMTTLISTIGFTAVTLSFSGTWDIQILGRNLFELFDWVASTFVAATVSLTIAIFVGYKSMKAVIHNIRRSAHVSSFFTRYFLITLRYVAPFSLGLLLLTAIYNCF